MHTRRMVVAAVALCTLLVSTWMLPAAAAAEGPRAPEKPLAEMAVGASRVDWQPAGDYEHLTLTVAGPEGVWLRREFEAGQPASLELLDQNGKQLPEGAYTYELRFVPGDAGGSPKRPILQAGSFAVRNGGFTSAFGGPKDIEPQTRKAPAGLEVIHDKSITPANACIGALCVPGDDAFYPILRLKDYYGVGILFEDIVEPFPQSYSRDWLLQANPNLGGPDHFFLQDIDAGTIPFSVQGNAPDYSLVVATGGNVGVGTAIPAQDLTVVTNNTPTIRLEQSFNPSAARSWDLGANHTELFVKDVTNSSSVPFRIKAGAPADSLVVAADGRVGIGTASPSSTRLDVRANTSGQGVARFQNSSSTGYSGAEYLNNSGSVVAFFGSDNAAGNTRLNSINNYPLVLLTESTERLRITSGGNIGIGTASPTHPLQMASGAHVTAGGVWTNASSRDLKHDIRSLGTDEARAALARLEPVRFRYNADPDDESLGFVAEDVPDLVATGDRKTLSPMDLVAVLTRVVQEQQKAIGDLQATVASLSEKLAAVETRKESGQ